MLEAAGHRALAPDLPGMGNDRTPFAADTLGQWADFTADLIRAQDEPVILAGHSRGGIVISETAERVPDRIARLAYVTAFLLPQGVSLFDTFPSEAENSGPLSIVIDEANRTCTVPPDNQHAAFFNLCSDADSRTARERLCPEPLQPLGKGVQVTADRFGRVPRAYIEASKDEALTLDVQRAMQSELPCDRVITLESDHSPFYSAPRQLTDALLALAT
jgi:pimeloyl-ACP methyl ester carboxylesterase